MDDDDLLIWVEHGHDLRRTGIVTARATRRNPMLALRDSERGEKCAPIDVGVRLYVARKLERDFDTLARSCASASDEASPTAKNIRWSICGVWPAIIGNALLAVAPHGQRAP